MPNATSGIEKYQYQAATSNNNAAARRKAFQEKISGYGGGKESTAGSVEGVRTSSEDDLLKLSGYISKNKRNASDSTLAAQKARARFSYKAPNLQSGVMSQPNRYVSSTKWTPRTTNKTRNAAVSANRTKALAASYGYASTAGANAKVLEAARAAPSAYGALPKSVINRTPLLSRRKNRRRKTTRRNNRR